MGDLVISLVEDGKPGKFAKGLAWIQLSDGFDWEMRRGYYINRSGAVVWRGVRGCP